MKCIFRHLDYQYAGLTRSGNRGFGPTVRHFVFGNAWMSDLTPAFFAFTDNIDTRRTA